ncbi:MAG: hypothetical protein AAFR95_13960 [Bacteroidota bacterium]
MSNQPTHDVCVERDGKLRRIGAGWKHQNADGVNLMVDFGFTELKLVVLPRREKDGAAQPDA